MIERRAFVLGVCTAPIVSQPVFAAAPAVDPEMLRRIFSGTNAQRASKSVGSLKYNQDLSKVAFRYAETLANSREFSHTVGGTNLPQRVANVGYSYRRLAENIGWAQRKASQPEIADWFVHAWMKSRGHRRNILDGRLSEIGVGVARRGKRFYAVQVFGKPA